MSREIKNRSEEPFFGAVNGLINLAYRCDKDRAREISDYVQKTLDEAYDKIFPKQAVSTN